VDHPFEHVILVVNPFSKPVQINKKREKELFELAMELYCTN